MNLREGFAKALRSRGTISFIERWFDGRVNSKGDFYAWQLCVAHLHAQSFHRGRMPHENAREQKGQNSSAVAAPMLTTSGVMDKSGLCMTELVVDQW